MGSYLLKQLERRTTNQQRFAFWVTLAAVLLIHIFKFTNTLPNHDSVYNYYSDQNVLGSGRWALSLACGISSYFDLPWIIGLFSAVYIALTSAVIISIFQITNPVVIVLCGALLAAAPATTETFFFLFTADGYMLAMLLAALSVWWSRIEEKRLSRYLLGSICICVSCGIYQAYVSFALVLAVCYFLHELFRNRFEKREYFRWIWRQVLIFGVSLAAYYIIWKLMLFLTGTEANDYQGISSVGSLNLNTILTGLIRAIRSVMLYFLQWNVLEHGLTLYSVLSIAFILAFCSGLWFGVSKSGVAGHRWALLLVGLCLAALVPFSCIWCFVSDTVSYRPMMLQCLTILFIFTAVLFETWAKPFIREMVGLLLAVVVLVNGLMANISYFYMDLCYERTYAQAVEMLVDIHDLQDQYEFERIAVVGNIPDYGWKNYDQENGSILPSGQIQLLSNLLERTLLLDAEHTVLFLNNTMGLELEPVNLREQRILAETDTVMGMPCWPAEGSMQVIDGVLVIKLAETTE